MKSDFMRHIVKKKLFAKTDKLLLGLSGGKDSMALAHLLIENGYSFAVAHCNFGLRGEESEQDELFVKEYFEKKNIPVFAARFNTNEYAETHNCSIQMAARELRYHWFNELLLQHSFNYVLTAHHANDNVETFFINLLRGSGLKGLKGIPEKTKTMVRPLLNFTREEIDSYITENAIPYREDSSNREEKYLRNKLRKQLIPLLKEINPSLEETMSGEMKILQQSYELLTEAVSVKLKDCIKTETDLTIIDLAIIETTYRELLLQEAMKPFNFNSDIISQLNESIDTQQSGKQFHSSTHTAVIDRNCIIVFPAPDDFSVNSFEITETTEKMDIPIPLTIQKQKGAVVLPGANVACLDADKTGFPLYLTRWKEGDSFRPMGMKGSKKLSDFFTDQKMNLFEKQQQWVLRSGKEIVWVVGRRIDERFKVDENSKHTLVLEWQQ